MLQIRPLRITEREGKSFRFAKLLLFFGIHANRSAKITCQAWMLLILKIFFRNTLVYSREISIFAHQP